MWRATLLPFESTNRSYFASSSSTNISFATWPKRNTSGRETVADTKIGWYIFIYMTRRLFSDSNLVYVNMRIWTSSIWVCSFPQVLDTRLFSYNKPWATAGSCVAILIKAWSMLNSRRAYTRQDRCRKSYLQYSGRALSLIQSDLLRHSHSHIYGTLCHSEYRVLTEGHCTNWDLNLNLNNSSV